MYYRTVVQLAVCAAAVASGAGGCRVRRPKETGFFLVAVLLDAALIRLLLLLLLLLPPVLLRLIGRSACYLPRRAHRPPAQYHLRTRMRRGIDMSEPAIRIPVGDAEQMLSIVGNDELMGTATEVRRRLSAVVDRAARG